MNQQVTRLDTRHSGVPKFDANNIADFMAKPVLLASGTVTTADTAMTLKYSTSIRAAMESKQIWYRKLAGYNLVRGTAVVKVSINANPFQASKLIATFLPCYTHMTTTERNTRCLNLGQITTQPNVELDSSETSFEMRIPYITPANWLDRATQLYDWGTFFLYVLAPLQVGASGETAYNYNVFLSFENFELSAPTYGPESGLRSKTSYTPSRIIQAEKSQLKEGSIAGSASKAFSVADKVDYIFGDIPVVGKFAKTAAHVAGAVADVASLFGWSKPRADVPVEPRSLLPHMYVNNTSGGSMAQIASFNHDHTTQPHAGLFGHEQDEMSFPFLKSIPGYFTTFNWTVNDAANAELYNNNLLYPRELLQTSSSVKTTSIIPYRTGTPLFMLDRFFQAYRGGVELTFKFNKTAYHSGRLLIAFDPNASNDFTISQTDYLLREIVDLKESNSVTLQIPYLKGMNYVPLTESLGRIKIFVLNELRAPETCGGTVNVLCYSRPAEDFEFAGQGNSNFMLAFTPESGYNNPSLATKPIGNASLGGEAMVPHKESYADPILSVKQLLNAARPLRTGANCFLAAGNYIYPFSRTLAFNTAAAAGTPQVQGNSLFGDYLSIISSGYAFERGGVRITNNNCSASTTRMYFIDGLLDTADVTSAPTEMNPEGVPLGDIIQHQISNPNNNIMVDVQLPSYQQGSFRQVRFSSVSSGRTLNSPRDQSLYQYGLACYGSFDANGYGWMRSMADDYQLGYFIGFMPVVAV